MLVRVHRGALRVEAYTDRRFNMPPVRMISVNCKTSGAAFELNGLYFGGAMRSENETIHYRARFEIYPKRDGVDILGGVASIMLEWFARKEKNLAKRDADVFSESHQLNAKMVRTLFSEGRLELPDGYDGGVGRVGRSSVCTKSIIDEQGEQKCWAFEYDEPDARERFRHWHTSVGVSRKTGEKRCVVNIRITYYMMPGFIGKPPSTPPSTTPRFVRSIIEASGWAVCVGDTEVLREECYLDANSFGQFKQSLLSTSRVLPLVLITTDYKGATAVWDASELAQKVLGMANVYVFDWRNEVLKKQTVFQLFRKGTPAYRYGCATATLRIYQPGVNLEDGDASVRHRFFKKDWIDEQRYGDKDGFVETLSRSLSRSFVTDEDDVVDVQDVKRKGYEQRLKSLNTRMEHLQQRMERAREEQRDHTPAKDAGDEIKYLREQLEAVRQDRDEWYKLAVEYSEQDSSASVEAINAAKIEAEAGLREAEDRIAEKDYRIDVLQTDCNQLRKECNGLRQSVHVITSIRHLPTTLVEELDLVEKLWPSKVVVLDEAKKSAGNFTGDFDEQWQILSSVPTTLWDIYFGESVQGDICERYRQETGFELALTETKLTKVNNALMRERVRRYRGQEIDVRPHIKGRSKNPKYAFRVHYYVDRERRLIVIGHCGGHLTTSGTQRIK